MAAEHEEHFPNYVVIWAVLMVLTATSIVVSLLVNEFAPFLQRALLVFLFGLGALKASLVIANFMHLRFESKVLWVLGLTALIFVVFFLTGTFFDLTATVKR
ncbi:MAG: cytochrome C oxidase subunit IV family protein [Chloroflexi bacterium]|nr:cytochrome C oxidase subunit IV family protein [Chloroflexota bacterium]